MAHLFLKIRSTYTICILGVLVMMGNFFIFKNPIIGIMGFLLYIIPLAKLFAKKFFSEQKTENILYGLLIIITELIISASLLYYIYQITPLFSFLLLGVPLIPPLFFRTKPVQKQETPITLHTPIVFIAKLSVIILDIFLLLYLFFHRTYELAPSPWTLTQPIFFITYIVTTSILFYTYKKSSSSSHILFLTSLHFFVSLAVAALLYPLGYGFDAFIHRVTETWIQQNGFISPKQPYYIGQYALVVMISNITQIKIFFLDIFLVPLLSAILLPGIVLSTLKQWFEKNNNLFYSALSFWIIAFIPFLSLQLTTPHNLVLLFTLLLVFTNFSFLKKHISFFIPLLISTAALMTHPLIGAPGLVFTLSLFSLKKLNHQKKYILPLLGFTFLVLCFLLPVMFTLNAVRIEKPLPTLGNPFTHIASFFELFKYPYWYAKTSPLRFEILYFCERLIVPTTLILSAFGFWKHQKHTSSKIFFIFPLTSLALFIDAWLLRSWIVFPDVVTYEQGDYPLRLIHTSIIFLLPFAMYGWSKLYDIKYSEKLKNFLIFFLLPIVLGITLYFSYPQKNVKVRFPGYNVTATDFKVVKWIHSQNTTYDYIVLSNQLVSAAALTEYSFAQYFKTPSGELFYYSIPTGGLMYKYYGKMIYEGQKPEYMTEAMDTVGVKKAYFVVNSYWANSKAIIEEAKKTAHQSQAFDGGTIWVFEYIHP